jgi:hypothetical protein
MPNLRIEPAAGRETAGGTAAERRTGRGHILAAAGMPVVVLK